METSYYNRPRKAPYDRVPSRYEALPRNAVLVALPLDRGRASGSPFPGRAWERVRKPRDFRNALQEMITQ